MTSFVFNAQTVLPGLIEGPMCIQYVPEKFVVIMVGSHTNRNFVQVPFFFSSESHGLKLAGAISETSPLGASTTLTLQQVMGQSSRTQRTMADLIFPQLCFTDKCYAFCPEDLSFKTEIDKTVKKPVKENNCCLV